MPQDARLDKVSKIALALPETARDIHHGCAAFRVRKKTFAYYLNNHHGDGICSIACKALPGDNQRLTDADPARFYLPAYIGARGWVALRLDRGKVDWEEVADFVRGGYVLVAREDAGGAGDGGRRLLVTLYFSPMEPLQVTAATLRELFRAALDLPASERDEFLNNAGLTAEAKDELRALLAADADSEEFLGGIVHSGAPATPGIGERFGPFETRELIGAGGMGAVFKAERVDGEVRQTVAIKIVEKGWLDPRAVERFRREREMLARLEHPNIARLIDGGTRADGVAYLAMEYVEGLPLDGYIGQRGLSVAERLRLFLPLCAAVDYAHQKLVVHRDLKPSNVMVTAEGVPKLLDFGIAQALDAQEGQTRTIALTPEFASPEQLRGEDATTRTDVYGLGAVLCFLLTGRGPRAPKRSELTGDLRNILSKALHDEPVRRYHSARELAEDVERYLAQRPVRATPDGIVYRATRFVQRHTFACAAGVIGLLAFAGGAVAYGYQAHRAQQRFAQVRQLANKFVFDFEASIRDTPGTLAARRMVAATARQYLADLSADAGHDAGLDRELAESYYRLSRVELSAGESPSSLEHLKRAVAILKSLHDDCCGPAAEHAKYISWASDLARIDRDARSLADGIRTSDEILANARTWYSKSPNDYLAGVSLANALSTAGNLAAANGQATAGHKALAEAVALGDRLLAKNPSDDDAAYSRARAGHWDSNALTTLGDAAAARDVEERSAQILDNLLANRPTNTRWRTLRSQMSTSMAAIYRKLAETDPSLKPKVLEAAQDAYRQAAEASRQAPDDKDLLDGALVMTTRLGNQLVREGRARESLPLFEEAGRFADDLVRVDPAGLRNLYLQASNRQLRGAVLKEMGNYQGAVEQLPAAEAMIQTILDKWPDDLVTLELKMDALMNQAVANRHLGRLEIAKAKCAAGMAVAAELMVRNKDAKRPVADLEVWRAEARLLGVPDPTLSIATK